MPTLRELQTAIGRHLLGQEVSEATESVIADGLEPASRLAIYRNTFVAVLTNALRLSYPAVHRLVGDAFFNRTAAIFVERTPPQSPYLNDYGASFADFLVDFPPAASLPYLVDVARLEWAIASSLNAADAAPLDMASLATLAREEGSSLSLLPHPAVALLRVDFPADTIWRAVLGGDDAVMAAIDLGDGPAWLLVERDAMGVEVVRMAEPEWHFLHDLWTGRSLDDAVADTAIPDVAVHLARHFTAGRFAAARVVPVASPPYQESHP